MEWNLSIFGAHFAFLGQNYIIEDSCLIVSAPFPCQSSVYFGTPGNPRIDGHWPLPDAIQWRSMVLVAVARGVPAEPSRAVSAAAARRSLHARRGASAGEQRAVGGACGVAAGRGARRRCTPAVSARRGALVSAVYFDP
uniref:Uncharacterized protein n=1 Tax=Oryza meridionalis TaxID=40149 RepID=A0A0E0ELZ7_9ORYZ